MVADSVVAARNAALWMVDWFRLQSTRYLLQTVLIFNVGRTFTQRLVQKPLRESQLSATLCSL